MAIYELGDRKPVIPASCHVSAEATTIGSVILGERVSIWFGAVLRADNEPIIIGDDSNVQDGAVLHTDPGVPLTIVVGHLAAYVRAGVLGDADLSIGLIGGVAANAQFAPRVMRSVCFERGTGSLASSRCRSQFSLPMNPNGIVRRAIGR